MGMDVYGIKPTSEAGAYYRANVWWWHPLADYIIEVAPHLSAKCRYWHSNDGSGLGGRDSKALAEVLQTQIDGGHTQQYEARHEAARKATPRKTCHCCGGTGVRTDAIGVKMGQPEKIITAADLSNTGLEVHPRLGQKGWCNGCSGVGTQEGDDSHYPFAVENVQEFVNFLRDCGGFQIN
jgi:hypothetical protein